MAQVGVAPTTFELMRLARHCFSIRAVPTYRIELQYTAYETVALPLSYVGKSGFLAGINIGNLSVVMCPL